MVMVLTYFIPLLLVATIGWLHLEYPFHGDQTVFMMGATAMDRGDVLYVDYWDTKQPGVFCFYWLGGKLFGFFEFGVHALELAVLLLFSAGMIGYLRWRLDQAWLAGAAPVATVAMYYAVSGIWELTQIEFLVSIPLFMCFAFVSSERPSRLAWFASGIAAGVAVMFKLLLAPIPVAIWAVASVLDRRSDDRSLGSLIGASWLPAVSGVLLVIALNGVLFAAYGAVGELTWTAFVYPLGAVGGLESAGLTRLASSARWFASFFIGPLIFMLMIGMSWKGAMRERWVLLVLAWLAAAVAVILLQSLSWWQYHFLLLVVPVGILAVRGADGIITAMTRSQDSVPVAAVVTAVFIVALLPGIRAAKSKWIVWRDWQVSAQQGDPVAFRRAVSPTYDRIWRDTEFLRVSGATTGPIYSFGDPRYVMLGNRTYALAINGWSWESMLDEHWEALPAQLEAAMPAYICVEPMYANLIRERAPAVDAWIRDRCEVLGEDTHRTWYRLRRGVDADGAAR